MSRWALAAAGALFALALAGCSGSDGKDGAPGTPGKDVDPAVVEDLQQQIDAIAKSANPETCVTCHTGENPVARSGPMHQELYKELYQDGVVKASNLNVSFDGVDTTTVTFNVTKSAGSAFDCRNTNTRVFQVGSYWASYDPATGTFPDSVAVKPGATNGTISWDAGAGLCTFTKKFTGAELNRVKVIAASASSMVQLYGMDEILEIEGQIRKGKYPFAAIKTVGAVNYASAANVSGCENCHTRPFLKHAYIYGKVDGKDFYTCKGCHYDTRNGGHQDWQLLKDDPERYAELDALARAAAAAGDTTKDTVVENMTQAEKDKYAYKAKLMNDVHMSHAMEFAYPQSMKNCVTCHAGKLDTVLADSKFVVETCKSCHAVDNLKAKMAAAAGFNHASVDLNTANCAGCHGAGVGPTFKAIHDGGYDPKIYSSTGVRYSDTFKVTIDSATFADNKLTIKFHATESPDVAGVSIDNIRPMVLIGLYGYDSKDFIVAAHGYDSPSGTPGRARLLEWYVDQTNPRFALVSAANGSWEVTADLSMWADRIGAGKEIRRAEIAILPELRHPSIEDPASTATPKAKLVLGLNAPSRTFDLAAKVFDDGYFKDIVDVANGCNTCHDQLATTFHSGMRGGNIKVCRICHEVSSAGGHLELQSRSIDSYIHGIHSFQPFDIATLDTATEEVHYRHHTDQQFPRFGILNCESCHKPGMYNVPNQAKSMPGVLSGASDDVTVRTNIPNIGPAVSGPAVRACGGCHRAQKLNADDASGLMVLLQHFRTFGYYIETESTAEAQTLWASVVAKMMALFK